MIIKAEVVLIDEQILETTQASDMGSAQFHWHITSTDSLRN